MVQEARDHVAIVSSWSFLRIAESRPANAKALAQTSGLTLESAGRLHLPHCFLMSLPDPSRLFPRRAQRALAAAHQLGASAPLAAIAPALVALLSPAASTSSASAPQSVVLPASLLSLAATNTSLAPAADAFVVAFAPSAIAARVEASVALAPLLARLAVGDAARQGAQLVVSGAAVTISPPAAATEARMAGALQALAGLEAPSAADVCADIACCYGEREKREGLRECDPKSHHCPAR